MSASRTLRRKLKADQFARYVRQLDCRPAKAGTARLRCGPDFADALAAGFEVYLHATKGWRCVRLPLDAVDAHA